MAANPSSPDGGATGPTWQEKLEEHCRNVGASAPVFEILSDRRGGRTAWSATVNIASLQQKFSARFWYDGQYVKNAKEDASEVALKWFSSGGATGGGGPAAAGGSGGAGSSSNLGLRGGGGPAFSASSLLPDFNSLSGQQHRANSYGVIWPRVPDAQQGGSKRNMW